jgi:hypothetical protein
MTMNPLPPCLYELTTTLRIQVFHITPSLIFPSTSPTDPPFRLEPAPPTTHQLTSTTQLRRSSTQRRSNVTTQQKLLAEMAQASQPASTCIGQGQYDPHLEFYSDYKVRRSAVICGATFSLSKGGGNAGADRVDVADPPINRDTIPPFSLSFIKHTKEAEGTSAQSNSLGSPPRDLLQDEAPIFLAWCYSEQPHSALNVKCNINTKPVDWTGTYLLPPRIETTEDKKIARDELFDDTIGYVNSLATLFLVVLPEYHRFPQARLR